MRSAMLPFIVFSLLFCWQGVYAHEENEVSITNDANYRYITSNGIPTTHGQFPNRGNPNTVQAQTYTFRMPLKPQFAARVTPLEGRMDFGVGIDGVPFDPGTAEFWHNDPNWRYEALSGKIDLGLDQNNAHVQPNGAYHYHGIPTDLVADKPGLQLVGYAADGFPIYTSEGGSAYKSSYRLRSGVRPSGPGGTYDGTFTADYEYVANLGDLDECNGRFATSINNASNYFYYVTNTFPTVPRCFKGTPDPSFYKQGPGEPMGPGSFGGPVGPGGMHHPPPR